MSRPSKALISNRGLTPFPAEEQTIAGFCIRHSTTHKVATLKTYMSAIRWAQINRGFVWDLQGSAIMERTWRVLKRRYPASPKALKFAVTFAVIQKILPQLPGWPNPALMSHNDRLFAAATVIGTSGFLRGGEFLAKPNSKRPVLTRSAVRSKRLDLI